MICTQVFFCMRQCSKTLAGQLHLIPYSHLLQKVMRERTGFIRGLLILSYLTEKNAILCKKGDNSKHTTWLNCDNVIFKTCPNVFHNVWVHKNSLTPTLFTVQR